MLVRCDFICNKNAKKVIGYQAHVKYDFSLLINQKICQRPKMLPQHLGIEIQLSVFIFSTFLKPEFFCAVEYTTSAMSFFIALAKEQRFPCCNYYILWYTHVGGASHFCACRKLLLLYQKRHTKLIID